MKEFLYCASCPVRLKLSIFGIQKLVLHQNGVEFNQQSIGDIRISLATLYDIIRRRATESKFLVSLQTDKVMYGGRHAA